MKGFSDDISFKITADNPVLHFCNLLILSAVFLKVDSRFNEPADRKSVV